MPARTLVVGLDAVDPELLVRWCGEGRTPRCASLFRQAAAFRLASPIAVIGGGVWEELNSGQSCGRAGVFFPPRQLRTGESAPRPLAAHEIDPRGYWTAASDAGKRVAAIDVPHAVPPPGLNGVFVGEWGTHDRLYGTSSVPPELAGELSSRHGDYPLWQRPWPQITTAPCDAHDGTPEQYGQLLDDLLAGIDRKTDILLDVLGRESWDLFACGLSEGHCSGHQFWHLLDADSPNGDRLATAIPTVYEHLDRSLGRLIDAAGPDATVFIVASHGFVDPTGGSQLIPEVLTRLGYSSGGEASVRARQKIPAPLRRLVRRVLPKRATETLQTRVGTSPRPLESPRTKAAAMDGDCRSWIRLNVRGREPNGTVELGAEADEILGDIRAELLALEHPQTGEKIVSAVQSAVEAYGPDHHPDVPDLIVSLRDDLGVLDACRSSRVGLVRVPFELTVRRTGAHPAMPSALWIVGPTVPSPPPSGEGEAIDLAPTILSQLDVPLPDWIHGKPLL